MNRRRPASGLRATALAVALFAITLNFLQPLAHAAMMRDGGATAAARTWGVFCLPGGTHGDEQKSPPAATELHECCLGLAHAPALAEPSTSFIRLEPIVRAIRFVAEIDALSPVGIRDGPSQPRAPPLFV